MLDKIKNALQIAEMAGTAITLKPDELKWLVDVVEILGKKLTIAQAFVIDNMTYEVSQVDPVRYALAKATIDEMNKVKVDEIED